MIELAKINSIKTHETESNRIYIYIEEIFNTDNSNLLEQSKSEENDEDNTNKKQFDVKCNEGVAESKQDNFIDTGQTRNEE